VIETKEQVIGSIKTDDHAAEFVQYGTDQFSGTFTSCIRIYVDAVRNRIGPTT